MSGLANQVDLSDNVDLSDKANTVHMLPFPFHSIQCTSCVPCEVVSLCIRADVAMLTVRFCDAGTCKYLFCNWMHVDSVLVVPYETLEEDTTTEIPDWMGQVDTRGYTVAVPLPLVNSSARTKQWIRTVHCHFEHFQAQPVCIELRSGGSKKCFVFGMCCRARVQDGDLSEPGHALADDCGRHR